MPNAVDGVLRVVPQGAALTLTEQEAGAILEIAFLAIASDRKLRDEELVAFRAVADRLRVLAGGKADPMSDREFELVLERFGGDLDRNVAEERLRIVGAQLTRPDVKQVAYKVAYALALCDLDTSDEEFEFDLQLVDALELTPAQAEDLEGDVIEAFQVG